MLRQRVITATVLLVIIVWALFYAPPLGLGSAVPGADGRRRVGMGDADRSRPEPAREALRIAGLIAIAGLAYLAWRREEGPVGIWLIGLLVLNLLLWIGMALPAVLARASAAPGHCSRSFSRCSRCCASGSRCSK